jgi:KaiC/GvpD/RAD55 family RecA-like ATPase
MGLHHQTNGSEAGLALWNDWSVPSTKYPTDGFRVLENKWDSFGRNSDKPVTLNTLRRLANVATADDFSTPHDPTRFAVRKFSEFADRPPLQWFVKQLIPRAGMGVIYGESGSGKTFFITDLALSIAQGHQWRDHRTNKAKVVYVCAEGFSGFLNRLRAYSEANSVDLSAIDFGIIADVPNLLKLDHIQVAEQVEASGGADIIIIDTFAQVTPGANENGAEDMGKALSHCRELHEKTGAMVLLVHHAGKDASRGARGWSGIKAAADVEIEISRQDDVRCARVTKLKDSEDGAEYFFTLKTVGLGVDADGDVVSSCVLEAIDKPVLESTTPDADSGEGAGARGGNNKPRGMWESLVYRLVSKMGGTAGLAVPCYDLVAEAITQSPPADGPDRRQERINRAMMSLQDKGCVNIKDGQIWLNLQDLA